MHAEIYFAESSSTKHFPGAVQIRRCLEWLAHFHLLTDDFLDNSNFFRSWGQAIKFTLKFFFLLLALGCELVFQHVYFGLFYRFLTGQRHSELVINRDVSLARLRLFFSNGDRISADFLVAIACCRPAQVDSDVLLFQRIARCFLSFKFLWRSSIHNF